MKIIAGKYPEEKAWENWLTFVRGPEIVLVFLWRLAAYMRDVAKVKATLGWGYRSYEDQVAAYERYLAGTGNLAAKPGYSWHQYGCAVDVRQLATGKYPGTIDADYNLFMLGKPEITLPKYGLVHSTHGEPWHIIPIECIGIPGSDRATFLESDDQINGRDNMIYCKYLDPESPETLTVQAGLIKLGIEMKNQKTGTVYTAPGGNYGDATASGVAIFKQRYGIAGDGKTFDGDCVTAMFKAINAIPDPTPISQAQLDAANLKYDALMAKLKAIVA